MPFTASDLNPVDAIRIPVNELLPLHDAKSWKHRFAIHLFSFSTKKEEVHENRRQYLSCPQHFNFQRIHFQTKLQQI